MRILLKSYCTFCSKLLDETHEEWSSRRYMEPAGIEALWERPAFPLPDPPAGQVDRARSRIIALAELDWMEEAA